MLRLSHAVGRVLRKKENRPTVLIGKDTRVSGYMIESALESGFNSAGVDVVLLGPLPTPGVAYLTRALRASLGVVISASHNPYQDNGIKFFNSNGSKLSDGWELEVEQAMEEAPLWAQSADLGKSRRLDDASGRYLEFCKSTFDGDLSLKGLKIVVDAAHGAAYHIAPLIFEELGAQVVGIGCMPDGFNINDKFGATHPNNLIEAVKQHRADFGIALDGDADRLLVVNADGRLFNGDELLYLLVKDRLDNGERLSGVVGTLMTNKAVELALIELGIKFERSKVGDRYVLEAMHKNGWKLGGEGSGHLLVLDKHTTGDGLISALQVLQACVRSGKSLTDLISDVVLFPQVLLNLKLLPDQNWSSNPTFIKEVQAVEVELGQFGRVLVRQSGTEPLLRIMVEAKSKNQALTCAKRISKTLE